MSSEDQEIDYYELLDVTYNDTREVIDKAYRRAAIRFHPDKNRDNTLEATNKFLLVSKAYQTLIDPKKKLEYDTLHKARIAAKKRYEALDTKRKAMKEELEEGEKIAKQAKKTVSTEESKQAKIERLREETLNRRRERDERLRQAAIAKSKLSSSTANNSSSSNLPPIYRKSNFNFNVYETMVLNKMLEVGKLEQEIRERESRKS
ncbi:hypothetical protein Glove_355g84 [Diversispora epigaea]|uniref:J domain-containing protein n=1 Tax=Diversispora epigaea TaxID=1348612 RepID=A0A397HB26_9GLOM|nr:hypothetical protein Glove_355g84 [Diversispora epigaea]